MRLDFRVAPLQASVGVVSALLLASLTWGTASASAATVEPTPVPARSYYVGSTSTTQAENEGCEQGEENLVNLERAVVILDFGGQLKDGGAKSIVVSKLKFTRAQIEAYAEAFANGYLACYEPFSDDAAPAAGGVSQSLALAIGTSNDLHEVSEAGGTAWAGDVAAVARYVLEYPAQAEQVAIWGGNDFENAYSTGSKALKWAKGYSAATESPYVDYGDAGGCSETNHKNESCTLAEHNKSGWDQKVFYEVSWGIRGANPTPEIYVPGNAQQWGQIDLYGGGTMSFLGPLDENREDEPGGGFDPNEAWHALHSELSEEDLNYGLPYSLTI